MPSPTLLDETLRTVTRRYRLPSLDPASSALQATDTATRLALAIEQARQAKDRGVTPDERVKRAFIDALANTIHEAMRDDRGDSAFQAMVLRHTAAAVREYASLFARADRDRRTVHAAVNALAHPGKLQGLAPGPRRDALARLHTSATASDWPELRKMAHRLLAMRDMASDAPAARSLRQLLDGDALRHLERLDELASEALVLRYRSLWEKHGPRSGSHAAAAQGAASRRRGAEVEALAAQALTKLAQRLDVAEGKAGFYRIVTSMRVPASIAAGTDHAKSEWDVVLLKHVATRDAVPAWDVCLLVEAKASVDAAAIDLPRLLRGLQLLASAKADTVYPFETQQGVVQVRGASLQALTSSLTDPGRLVLYCCDARAEPTPPRLLSAASRMQLLSAIASLEYAGTLAENGKADRRRLEPVWHQLLESPRWRAILDQYLLLDQARVLMVHVDDLSAAIDGATEGVPSA
jgi:hypothetical protein